MTRKILVRSSAVATSLVVVAAVIVGLHHDSAGTREVDVTMANAGPIEVGGDVRSAGVRVGTVKAMHLDGKRARMVLQVDRAVLPLHDDASVTVRPANLLGEDYVDLDPGTDSAPYTQSADIPASRTHVATTVQDLLDTFQAPTAAALADAVTTSGEGFQGNGAAVAKALGELSTSMQTAGKLGTMLSGQNDVLAQLVTTLDPVAAAVATDDGKTLDSLVGSTQETLNAVTAQQNALKATIDRLPATLASARRTLTQFQGVADQATPTLTAIRPLTSNLSQVVDEIQSFDAAANPALASLQPVLDRASALLDQAAPAVAQLKQTGPPLARASHNLDPVNEELLEKHLSGVMGFVRKWALSTNGHDSLSHYFRGVFYVTPSTLTSLLNSYLPTQKSIGATTPAATGTPTTTKAPNPLGSPGGLLGNTTGQLGQGLNNLVPGAGDTVTGLLHGLGLARKGARATPDATSAFGLSRKQEQAMLQQLLGGN